MIRLVKYRTIVNSEHMSYYQCPELQTLEIDRQIAYTFYLLFIRQTNGSLLVHARRYQECDMTFSEAQSLLSPVGAEDTQELLSLGPLVVCELASHGAKEPVRKTVHRKCMVIGYG